MCVLPLCFETSANSGQSQSSTLNLPYFSVNFKVGFVPFYLVQLIKMSLFPNIRFRLGGRRALATLLMFSQFSQTSAPSLTKGVLFVIPWLVYKSEVTIQEPTIITKDEPFPFLLLSMGMINHDPSHCSMLFLPFYVF